MYHMHMWIIILLIIIIDYCGDSRIQKYQRLLAYGFDPSGKQIYIHDYDIHNLITVFSIVFPLAHGTILRNIEYNINIENQ